MCGRQASEAERTSSYEGETGEETEKDRSEGQGESQG